MRGTAALATVEQETLQALLEREIGPEAKEPS